MYVISNYTFNARDSFIDGHRSITPRIQFSNDNEGRAHMRNPNILIEVQ